MPDVISAIQAAGTYKYYKQDTVGWADRISGDESKAEHWREVFADHPEFFRFDSEREKCSLVLRRQRQRLYSVDEERVWEKTRYDALTDAQKMRFSRLPLTSSEIEALIDVAINLHAKALEQQRDRLWWRVPSLAFAGAVLGGLVAKSLEIVTK